MARAARLSGEVDEDEQEIENLLQERREHPSELVSWAVHCTDESLVSVLFLLDEKSRQKWPVVFISQIEFAYF